jgi:hypothetical protein
MALPVLNDKPKYEMSIPTTGQIIKFRPYLVREEKVLMIALESQDAQQMFGAIVDTIKACVDPEADIKWNDLAVFDIEYMFIIIRSKSVGETAKIGVACEECETSNELAINLIDTKPDLPEISNIIELTDDISLEMQWPSFNSLNDPTMTNMSASDMSIRMLGYCIKYVNTADDRIIVKDEDSKAITNFIESLNTEQFEKIKNYTDKMPTVMKDVEFDCSECGHHNKKKLEGMADFF